MQLYDPTAQIQARHSVRARAPASHEGLTIGLLSNGKFNAELLLRETAACFVASHGWQLGPVLTKDNASAPAPAGMLEELRDTADLLITANGD